MCVYVGVGVCGGGERIGAILKNGICTTAHTCNRGLL